MALGKPRDNRCQPHSRNVEGYGSSLLVNGILSESAPVGGVRMEESSVGGTLVRLWGRG